MITRRRLQEMSPTGCRVKLLGTATSPQPILPKPKIKLEKIKREPIVKTEKQLEIEDYLAKGLCLSAHTDGSACANIQNPNNVNVPPMNIREHQRKQRADKALFLAGLIAKQTTANNHGNAVTTENIQDNPNDLSQLPADINAVTNGAQSNEILTTENTLPTDTVTTEVNYLNNCENSSRNAVTTDDPADVGERTAKPILSLKEHIDMLDRNGVTASNVAQEHTDSENNCDLNKTLTSDSFAEANVDTDLDKTLEYSVHKDNDSETFDTFRADDVNDAKSQTADTSQTDNVEVENLSESDTAELNVNKNTTKIYTHTRRTKPTLPHQPTAPVIDNTDIDMIEDTANAELINLSENLAETLVITDLEELMNAQDQLDTDAQLVYQQGQCHPRGLSPTVFVAYVTNNQH